MLVILNNWSQNKKNVTVLFRSSNIACNVLLQKMKADFMQLLNDTPDINRHSKWNDVKHRIDDRDPRYQAVGSNSLREDWFNEYVRNIGVSIDA